MLVWFLVTVLLCGFIIRVIQGRARESRAHKLPPMHPGWLPLLGHAHHLLGGTERLYETLKKGANVCHQLGGVMVGYMGSELYYVITDPDDVLTAANACLQKHYGYQYISFLGDGLFTSSGKVWKRHRALTEPTFSLPVVLGFLDTFNSQARRLTSTVEPHAGRGPIDLYTTYIKHSFSEAFCLTAFGTTSGLGTIATEFLTTYTKVLKIIIERFTTFYLHSDFIYSLLGYKKIETEVVKLIDNVYDEIIKQKKLKMERDEGNNGRGKLVPIIDMLLSMKDILTDKEIKDEVNAAILGGFDTTSTAFNYILMILGAHQDVQEKIYNEIMDVVGPDGDVEKEHLNKLVYTEAVIKETCRYFVGAPVLIRYVDKDVKLKNYTMRAGSQCALLAVGTNYHAVWGADRQNFRPERWLDEATLPKNINGAFGSFSWGKRSCIGKTYAMVNMKVTVAHFIRCYRVNQKDLSELKFRMEFVLRSYGHEISFEKRN